MSAPRFAVDGCEFAQRVLSEAECDAAAADLMAGAAVSAGMRTLLKQPWCRAVAERVRQHPALAALLPQDFVAVQCTSFKKSSSCNWLVALHQDLSIPVAERVEHPSLAGWSEKDGMLFVQPPVALLEQLVAARLHLDACAVDDGPLRVVPGSHLRGRIPEAEAAATRAVATEVVCIADRGSAWVLRPLLLHGSSKSSGSSQRRVLHFVFGPPVLPLGLRWQDQV